MIDEHMITEYYNHMEAFKVACKRGDLNAARSLFNKLNKPVDIGCIMIEACQTGHLKIIQFLMPTFLNTDGRVMEDVLFVVSCDYGNLHIAQWLVKYHDIDVAKHGIVALRRACEQGHLSIVKWLLQTYPHIDIHRNDDYMFALSDELSLVKWLLETYPNINAHAHHEAVFVNACAENNIELVRWLYENIPNIEIHARNEGGFKGACRFKSIDVMNFFAEITEYSDHFYYIGDNASYIVTKNTVTKLPSICHESYNIYSIGDSDYKDAIAEMHRRFEVSRKKTVKN